MDIREIIREEIDNDWEWVYQVVPSHDLKFVKSLQEIINKLPENFDDVEEFSYGWIPMKLSSLTWLHEDVLKAEDVFFGDVTLETLIRKAITHLRRIRVAVMPTRKTGNSKYVEYHVGLHKLHDILEHIEINATK
jgi:hypothetical protein